MALSTRFNPNPKGPVLLQKRNARRARLYAGGTYFRSKERGVKANDLQIAALEDLSVPEGMLIIQHTTIKPDENIFTENMDLPEIELFSLNLPFNQELQIRVINNSLVAEIYGIRWQISGDHTPELIQELGTVSAGKTFTCEQGSFKLDLSGTQFPASGKIILRPRVHRYPLVTKSDIDPLTLLAITGWDPEALRGAVNAADTWVRMPVRGVANTGPPDSGNGVIGEDITDITGPDTIVLTVFGMQHMQGGDGLPATPVGFNTGPTRVLVLVNYSEKEDGSLGDLNQVFEWVGNSALIGNWERYVPSGGVLKI